MNINIDTSWKEQLSGYFNTPDFTSLIKKVSADYRNKNKIVYPESQNLFRAFRETPLNTIKVVILGQDPYHNPKQAHGLCFSVPTGTTTPPSLLNIFKEVKSDTGSDKTDTDLTRWAQQGVFLLNTALSVLENQPASHSNIGWEDFTDHVIKTISDTQTGIVFMLWGAHARSKTKLIDTEKHLILEAPHPSPLSAYRGFFGCKHFTQANTFLNKDEKAPIQW